MSGPALASGQATMRAANLRLVLATVLAAENPVSRADVAALTSLTRATVSRLVDDLVRTGLLAEGEAAVGRPGRPAVPLVASPRYAALGLQVNAGYLAARVVDLRGEVVTEVVEESDLVHSDPEATLRRLGELAHQVRQGLRRRHLVGACLALPGLVSVEEGLLVHAPNLGWSDLRPAGLLGRAALGRLPLSLGNEADLAARAVAEPRPGRPGPLRDFLYLSGEIGIGGAAVLDGRVLPGRHGWAGELGHVCVDPAGPPCPCGSTGCLEQYAGSRALEAAGPAGVAEAGQALGIALAGVVNVLDIATVVLGGHLAALGPLVGADLEASLRSRVLSGRWVAPRVLWSDDDPAPGATGAALHELARVLADLVRWTG